jgi:hypothetical protein
MKKECVRTYKLLKKQSVHFVNTIQSCSGNQDTRHLREFATFVSYPGLIENAKSRQLCNLIYEKIKTGFKMESKPTLFVIYVTRKK